MGAIWCAIPAAGAPSRSSAPGDKVLVNLHRLKSSRWSVRHRAQARLLRAPPADAGQIQRALQQVTTPEDRLRLTRIALQLYLEKRLEGNGPRPFLGIRFMVYRDAPRVAGRHITAIYVAKAVRGFPAGRTLRQGDLILGINGRYFSPHMMPEDFVVLVGRFQAGTRITLNVLRGGHMRKLRLRLAGAPMGSFAIERLMAYRSELIGRYFALFAPPRRKPAAILLDTRHPRRRSG